ncbi:MAG: DUF1573 domain-containing protein [Bacteroidales bacterium]|nr:DUF1573 domain-containing protein [Bacteroidales bacterium]
MKKLTLLMAFVGFLFLGACQNQTSSGKTTATSSKTDIAKTTAVVSDTSNGKLPVMTFDETIHDFGKMVQGEVGKYNFHFKNTGNSDLVIKGVRTTCGCTVGSYPHDPIKPGEEGDLTVTFNSSFKQGYQNKAVMVRTNTNPSNIVLYIRARVSVPKQN